MFVCKNNLNLFSKLFKYNKKLKWFEKSIISILKKESINYNIVFCYSCFHIFISSEIESNLLYSLEASKNKKKIFFN